MMINIPWLKWLYPGLKIKRWLLLAIGGAIAFGIGAAWFAAAHDVATHLVSLTTIGAGLAAMGAGLVLTIRSVLEVAAPAHSTGLIKVVYQRRYLQKGLKVVAIGGGTGLSTLLRGLKAYTNNITAIVTVADDGGSSGRLREEFGILPPGDIRNCLVALAEAEPTVQRLFQHRFAEGLGLQGHNAGNLVITALARVTGDFEQAIEAASRVLEIRGRVIPSTYATVRLVAEHDDGSLTIGETNISKAQRPIHRLWLEPRHPLPSGEALRAIHEADVIIIGPGSLFTSLIPNLLVAGIVEALVNTSALKVYICNVMTQFRETHHFTASDHVRALIAQTHPRILDVCVVNLADVPVELLARYRKEQAFAVEADLERIRPLGYDVVTEDLISTENYVRHDCDRLARVVIQLAQKSGRPLYRFNGHGVAHG